MKALQLFRTKPHSWKGCRQLSAIERMAQYSERFADDMRQRENAGAGDPRATVVEGRVVLMALPGRVNALPKVSG